MASIIMIKSVIHFTVKILQFDKSNCKSQYQTGITLHSSTGSRPISDPPNTGVTCNFYTRVQDYSLTNKTLIKVTGFNLQLLVLEESVESAKRRKRKHNVSVGNKKFLSVDGYITGCRYKPPYRSKHSQIG
jgi:hypothetical protein